MSVRFQRLTLLGRLSGLPLVPSGARPAGSGEPLAAGGRLSARSGRTPVTGGHPLPAGGRSPLAGGRPLVTGGRARLAGGGALAGSGRPPAAPERQLGRSGRPCIFASGSVSAGASKPCHPERSFGFAKRSRRTSDFEGRRRCGAFTRTPLRTASARRKSQRFFDSVPSRLRPQGTAFRMTGWDDAPLRGREIEQARVNAK